MNMAIVCGAGGFIGSHLVRRLKSEGYWVRGVDLKHPEWSPSAANDFVIADLRDPVQVARAFDMGGDALDEVYQLAADLHGEPGWRVGRVVEHPTQPGLRAEPIHQRPTDRILASGVHERGQAAFSDAP